MHNLVWNRPHFDSYRVSQGPLKTPGKLLDVRYIPLSNNCNLDIGWTSHRKITGLEMKGDRRNRVRRAIKPFTDSVLG